MMPAAKHFDPVLGIDIHIIQPPGPVPPVPIPHPFIGMVIDPFDYVPILGATVYVNGMPRAQAGTAGKNIPVHIPIGGTFIKPPGNECEVFMGSSTVEVDGDAFSHLALPALSCQDIGIPPPPRAKKKSKTKSLVLPLSVVLPIPAGPPVLVGGPPTISLMALGMRVGMAGLGKAFRKFAKSGAGKRAAAALKKANQKVFKKMKPGFLKCKVLRAEPVDITTGEVFVDQEDFSIPGRITIQWTRHYGSHCDYDGVCGYGWQTPADARLELDDDGMVSFHDGGPGATVFECLPETGPVSEPIDGAKLERASSSLVVQLKDGQSFEFPEFEGDGRVVLVSRIRDRSGNYLEFGRDEAGLYEIAESSGRRVEVSSVAGRIQEMRLRHPEFDKTKPLVRFTYDEEGDLVAVHDSLGHAYRFHYDQHRLDRHTDRDGLSFYYEFDRTTREWRCIHSWGDGGLYDYRFGYDDVLGQTTFTDSLGHRWTVELDENTLPVKEVDPLGGETCFEYDDAGRCVAVVDQDGNRTGYEYDVHANLIQLNRADGATVQAEYDAHGRPVKIMDANGHCIERQWDRLGRLATLIGPKETVTKYQYNDRGDLVAVTNPRGAVTRFATDKYGNVTAMSSPLGHQTHLTFNAFGHVTTRTDPLSRKTLYNYDAKSRLTGMVLPAGGSIECQYDSEDNLIFYRDEDGFATRFEYAGLGELARRYYPDGNSVTYEYDTEERVTAVINQHGQAFRLVRDACGRVVKEQDYWGQTRTFKYSPCGHLRETVDAFERIVEFETDPLGRIRRKLFPDGSSEEFSYDANGNLTAMSNGQDEVTRTFDPLGRVLRECRGEFAITNEYDPNGNRVRRTSSYDNTVKYEYDLADEVVGITINDRPTIRIERDAAHRPVSERLSAELRREFRYDADGLLTSQQTWGAHEELAHCEYEYDRRGNLTRRADSRYGTDTFVHDPVGRILRHVEPDGKIRDYLRDSTGELAGPRTQLDNEDQPWHRTAEQNGVLSTYDAAGNLCKRRVGRAETAFEWDANNRLSTSRPHNGPATTYGYDPQGRRTFKQTDGNRTSFFWDENTLVGDQFDGRGVREFVYYPGDFQPVAVITPEKEVFYYHIDPNGLPRDLTDAEGKVVWSGDYTALGELRHSSVNDLDNPLRLQGQYYDSETGLCYNLNRYYDARTGSFTNKDHVGLAAGEDLYRYAPNVWAWVDPLGLACWSATPSKTSVENALGHFKKHGSDFPNIPNAKKYADESKKFLDNPPPGSKVKTRANGDTVVFDPATDTFAVKNATGEPKTMFKPDPAKHGHPTNEDYFNAQ